MRIEKAVGPEVLERMLSAYGFSMQKQLAEHLGIAKSNVAGWVQRGQVPGNAIVQCALDTGADVNWLVTGELEKANSVPELPNLTGKAVYDEVLANGGKPVLRRILDAYGFTLQKQLCELLDISSGTVSTWVRRNYFPGDVVVTCAIDTGVSLRWLATGKGNLNKEQISIDAVNEIPRKVLTSGVLSDSGSWTVDLSFIKHSFKQPVFISSNYASWIVDMNITDISNGKWLLGIDDKYDVYDITVLPGRKIEVVKTNNFICGIDEVKAVGKVIITLVTD
ncbi:phage repressor protein CI [Pantoea agglomerans]|uniref:phage repressor protein CI n=1 Tax=Enterobacter agglomerans TaxID=549 RepID=UPI003C7E123A